MNHPNQYPYTAKGPFVYQGPAIVCRAVSSMKARLIARALNQLTSREEGL